MIFAIWTIICIVFAVRMYWKHSAPSRHDSVREAFFGKKKRKAPELPITGNAGFEFSPEVKKLHDRLAAENAQKQVDMQKQREIEDLRKQGYSDELIAVIIPTINNGQ